MTLPYIKTDTLNDRAIVVSLGNDHLEAVSAIATKHGIVIIDAGLSNRLTTKYRHIIEQIFGRNDFAYLINTHAHPDHVGGNKVFREAVIIGHESAPKEMMASRKNLDRIKSGLLRTADNYNKQLIVSEPGSDEWIRNYCQKIRYQFAYDDLLDNRAQVLPEITFSDRLDLFMSDVTLNIIYFGNAHSASDIIIHIPEMNLLFTGDLFGPGGIEYIGQVTKQDAERWIVAMQWIGKRRNGINTIIGGHGERMTLNDLDLFEETVNEKLKAFK